MNRDARNEAGKGVPGRGGAASAGGGALRASPASALFPSGKHGNGAAGEGGACFAAFAAVPSGAAGEAIPAASFPAGAADAPGAQPARMPVFSSFRAPVDAGPGLASEARRGGGVRSRDVMDEELCASTFGEHTRLSDDEHEPPARGGREGAARPRNGDKEREELARLQRLARAGSAGGVFRVELSSDSDEDAGGGKRKKKAKKKDRKKEDKKSHKSKRKRERPGAGERDAGLRGQAETEREREVREDRETVEMLLKKQRRDGHPAVDQPVSVMLVLLLRYIPPINLVWLVREEGRTSRDRLPARGVHRRTETEFCVTVPPTLAIGV